VNCWENKRRCEHVSCKKVRILEMGSWDLGVAIHGAETCGRGCAGSGDPRTTRTETRAQQSKESGERFDGVELILRLGGGEGCVVKSSGFVRSVQNLPLGF
jgi:hypothetical protein